MPCLSSFLLPLKAGELKHPNPNPNHNAKPDPNPNPLKAAELKHGNAVVGLLYG